LGEEVKSAAKFLSKMQRHRNSASIHVVDPASIPNPAWLHPGITGGGQQAYGDTLLTDHKVIAIPGTVSMASWNLILLSPDAASHHVLRSKESFGLDTRLHQPVV